MLRIQGLHGRSRQLSIVWMGLVIVFAYMGVAPINSALFATGVILHASIGLVALRTLNPKTPVSLTMFLGPSLTVGGAVSFVLFQAVGRGVIGFAANASAGAIATIYILRNEPVAGDEDWTEQSFFGILTVGALVLTSEFAELIPAVFALALVYLSVFLKSNRPEPLISRFALLATALVLFAWSVVIRNEYWWIITDDYKFFQVLTQHITAHGVFEKWGAHDLSRYHWLSYGWSGILDGFGGSPEPLVTLTRVMPVVYSVSMAASLLLFGSILANRVKVTVTCAGTALLIVALNPLDWSGTSTAAAYAVLAALGAVVAESLRQQLTMTRRLTMYVVFLPIVAFTKLPSVIASLLAILTLETVLAMRQKWKVSVALMPVLSMLCLLGAMSSLLVLSSIIPFFSITRVKPQLGQLSWFGPDFEALALLLQRTPIWFLAIAIVIAAKSGQDQHTTNNSQHLLAIACLAFVPTAVLLDVVITANANAPQYFSGPFWFLSSVSILAVDSIHQYSNECGRRSRLFAIPTAVVAVGIIYQYVGERFWESLVAIAPEGRKLQVVLLQFVTSDIRVATSLMLVSLLIAIIAIRRRRVNVLMVNTAGGAVIGLVLLSALLLAPEAVPSRQLPRSAAELEIYLGSQASRSVGAWLRVNTERGDLVATNHLRDSSGGFLDDFSMAMWSNREFLVLGPRFGGGTNEVLDAVQLSDSFAKTGSDQSAQRLRSLGVRWFIVDTELTKLQTWSRSSDIGVQYGPFRILRIDD